MNTTSKIVTALIAGAAIGTAAGILFAPDKGSETRRKIKEKGNKLAGDVKDKLRQGKEKMNEVKESVMQSVKEKIEDLA